MSLPAFIAAASPGSRTIAAAIALVGLLRFLRWLVPFLCERLDRRSERLGLRETAIEHKMNQRLKHVEQELARWRTATMCLFNALAKKDPTNPALGIFAQIINEAIPINTTLEEFEAQIAALADLPGTFRGGKQ